jgi:opacity protein-like surface antigen
MFRYQIGRLEPYVGAGLGVYFLHIHDAATDTSISSNAEMGLRTKGGLRWRVTDHLALIAEWKYNQVNFDFDNLPIGSLSGGGRGQYHSHIAVGGIGWHF